MHAHTVAADISPFFVLNASSTRTTPLSSLVRWNAAERGPGVEAHRLSAIIDGKTQKVGQF